MIPYLPHILPLSAIRSNWIIMDDKRTFLAIALALGFLVLYVSVMGYAGDRITAWLNPEADAQNTGYQVLQSQYAIGSGGMAGRLGDASGTAPAVRFHFMFDWVSGFLRFLPRRLFLRLRQPRLQRYP